jgi:hypothetical protein
MVGPSIRSRPNNPPPATTVILFIGKFVP